jgi:hypothetical protein
MKRKVIYLFVALALLASLAIALVPGGPAFAAASKTPPVTLGPETLLGSGTPPTAFEFFRQTGSSWKGDIAGIIAGPTYTLGIEGINVTGVTGPADRYIYFNLQDAESGSTFKNLGISVRLDATGAGGGTLFQCYQNFTSDGLSSHGLNPGDLTAGNFSLRFDFTKASAGVGWTVSPYFRLSGGLWTAFFDGPFTATVPFDFLGAKFVAAFDGGADGTLSFNNFYLGGPCSTVYVDDDWAGLANGSAVQFPGETTYRTIGIDAFGAVQAGIDKVNSGGTVNVAAGTYRENLATWKDMEITKSLSLIGAGSGQTVVQFTAGKMNGMEIRGSGLSVTIEGITFTRQPGQTYASNYGLRIAETTSTFNSLVLRDVEVAYAQASNVMLEGSAGSTFSQVDIEDCYFHHAGSWGFVSGSTINNMTVRDSRFEYNGQVDPSHGNGFDLTGTSSNVLVDGGSFNNNTQSGINLMGLSNAIFRNFVANNNAGASGGGFGVKLDEWASKSQNITFEKFTANGNGLDGVTISAEKPDAIQNIRIEGATLSNNLRDGLDLVYINNGSNNPQMTDVKIECSSIYQNHSYGVQVWAWWVPMPITEMFDARNNWWGDASGPGGVGPGTGDAVSSNVYYTPWLGHEADSVQNLRTLQVYCTIQEAVDAAGVGDTIHVGAGTYDEQVVITRGLTLEGAGATTIVEPSSASKLVEALDVPNASGSTVSVAGIITVDTFNQTVTVKNLTVDGEGVTTRPGTFNYVSGIIYRETNGTIDTVTAENIVPGVAGTDLRGDGIFLTSSINAVSVEVKNSTFTNFDKDGIDCTGHNLTASIHNNTVTGRGALPSGDEVQNGIAVTYGAVGTVNTNDISDMSYTPTTWWAMGILFYGGGSGCAANLNTITNCQSGITAQDTSLTECSRNAVDGGTVGLNGIEAQYMTAGSYIVVFRWNTITGTIQSIPGYVNEGIGAWTYNAGASLTITIGNNTLTTGSATADGIQVGDTAANGAAGSIVATVTNNTVSNWVNGIHLFGTIAATSTITGNTLSSNGVGIMVESEVTAANVVVHSNNIAGNTGYGVNNAGSGTLNATCNWWGSACGPTHASNPGGTGDRVSNNVTFNPWSSAAGGPCTPLAPTLISPTNGTTFVPANSTITYRWNASCGATNYWFVVSTKNSLSPSDYSYFKTSRAVSGTTYTDTGYPTTSGPITYYWWVSAYNSSGWSDPSQVLANGFTLTNVGVPSAPTLISPTNGTTFVPANATITYRWNASTGATNYWFVVSTKNSLSPSDYSYFKTSRAVSGTTYTDTGYPTTSGPITYYWWVSAYDSAGWSDASQVLAHGFTLTNVGVPSAPTLISPTNGTHFSPANSTITYRWNAPTGATNYWFVVSTKNSLSPSDYSYYKTSRAVSGSTYTDTGYPTSGSYIYYWWVSAYDSAGWSDPSQVLAHGFTLTNGP